MRIDDHEDDERDHENGSADNSESIEVLLHDAGAHLAGHRTLDHLTDSSSLARVKHDEHDQTYAGKGEKNQHGDKQRIQCTSLLS